MPSDLDAMKRDLDVLAARGTASLRGWIVKQAAQRAVPMIGLFALVVPALLLGAGLIGAGTGRALWPLAWPYTLVLALIAPFAIVGVVIACLYWRSTVDRRMALALYDNQLGYEGRLQTADEFLGRQAELNGFERAAIEDALPYIRHALENPVPPALITKPLYEKPDWRPAVAALCMLIAGLWLVQRDGASRYMGEDNGSEFAGLSPVSADPADNERNDTPSGRTPRAPVANDNSSGRPASASFPSGSTDGKRVDGALSVSAASGMAAASGAAAGEASKNGNRKTGRDSPAGQRGDNRTNPASGGLGKGNGASSPNASLARSDADKDRSQPSSRPEDEAESVGNENDETQQAKSSMRPAINFRKGAADRRLSMSGNSTQENKQGNGRGGQSGLKKNRGVAAMLLAVPMPDRVQGTPNPGRTHVETSRGKPAERAAGLANAEQHGTRRGTYGTLAHPDLTPWMRELVRTYFETRREGASDAPPQTGG